MGSKKAPEETLCLLWLLTTALGVANCGLRSGMPCAA